MVQQNLDIIIRAKDYASKNLKSIVGGISAMVVFKKTFDVLKAGVAAYQVQETAANNLTSSLRLLGKEAQTQEMQAFASEIQSVTKATDEATMELMSLGASLGKMSGDTLKQATVAAMGYAKATGKDVKGAMEKVSKAAMGDVAGMKEMGYIYDETKTKADNFNLMLQQGTDAFSLAEAEINTTAGAYQQIKNSLNDYMSEIGKAIVQSETFQGALQWVGFTISHWKDYADIGIKGMQLAIEAVKNDIIYALTTEIPAYLDWFSRNWKAIFVDAANVTKVIFENLNTNIASFFDSIWSYIKGDGFNWEWTELTNGFKKTMEDLPKIADRPLSDLEAYLSDSLDKSFEKLEQAKEEAKKPLDKKFGAAELSTPEKEKAAKDVKQGSNAATESRFMKYRQGGIPKYEQAQIDTSLKVGTLVSYQGKMIKLTEKLLQTLGANTDSGAAGKANFSNIKIVKASLA